MPTRFNILQGNRLAKTIGGVQKRLDKYASAIDELQVVTAQNAESMRAEHANLADSLRETQAVAIAESTTHSDEEYLDVWSEFDRLTLQSLQKQQSKLAALKKEVAANKQQVAQKADTDIKAATTHVQNEKSRLKAALDANREALRRQKIQTAEFRQEATELLAKRHIDANALLQGSATESAFESQDDFASIRDRILSESKYAQQLLRELRAHPIARFSDSAILWLCAGAIAAAFGAVAWLLTVDKDFVARFLISFGTFGGGIVLIGIALLIAVRPWIKRFAATKLPELESTCQRIEQLSINGEQHLQSTFARHCEALDVKLAARLDEIKNAAASELKRLEQHLASEQIRITNRQIDKRLEAKENFETRFNSIQSESRAKIRTLVDEYRARNENAEQQLSQSIEKSLQQFQQQTAKMRQRIQQAMDAARDNFIDLRDSMTRICPPWPDTVVQLKELPRGENDNAILPLGEFDLRLGLNQETALASADRTPLLSTTPAIFKMVEHGSLIIRAAAQHQSAAHVLLRNLVLRAFSSLPAGALQVTIIDPDGLGREFSHLMQLADTDPTLVNHRVWTQPVHIAEQLARLSHHTEDVIQQLLRDRYADVREYNREAGTMAEPFRLVVWSRFPSGVDEVAWRYLTSLISSGGRCGVSTVLMVDTSMQIPPCVDMTYLQNAGMTIDLKSNDQGDVVAYVKEPVLGDFPIRIETPPESDVQQQLLKLVADDSLRANRVEVPFASLIAADTPTYQSDSAHGLNIPVGHAGVGRNQMFRLGHGTAQHVLVAGKTGSGKSSFLHTLVTSAAMHYSPDQLRLVLLDFKKGVEFQVYSETQLPHADVIGIESQREFGVSTFEYLDRIMQQRGEAFRHAGVQDVAGWRKAKPDTVMPRILVVVDEFQEIFTEDDKLGQQAAMLLDRIVRQGRSFGIHVVLASQTLGGAYSLPRTTLAQMAVRVALQCEGSDAMMILGEDNLAAERLRFAGQAIYNDQSGRIEGNQPFQVAFLQKEEQRELLAALPKQERNSHPMHGGLEKAVVFDGHRKATWDRSVIAQSLEALQRKSPNSPALLLGDSVSIEPVVGLLFHRQAGQNLLLVGNDDENGASVLRSLVDSFVMNEASAVARRVLFIDASRDEDVHSNPLGKRYQTSDHVEYYAASTVDRAISQAYERMKEATAAHDSMSDNIENGSPAAKQSTLLVLTHVGRMRSLRRSEEFSFDDDADQMKADKMLQEILRDGPLVGIHTILWCDNAATFNRWLPRQSIHDLEYRALMQMSTNDSNHLIDSAAANRLDKNVMLVYEESSGLTRKFRPFALD